MIARLLSTSEAAAVLGVSRDTVVRLVHAGSLPVVDVSATGNKRRRIRVDEADLADWIARHKTIAAATATTGALDA